MTNEDMQRKMEFIVEHQARFAAHLEQLEQERIRDRPRLAELELSFQRLVHLAEITDARLDRLEISTDALETTMIALGTNTVALETNMVTLETNMAALATAQAHADERLSALMEVVRRERNGT